MEASVLELLQVNHTPYADYQAYLLRLWQDTPRSTWRVWLQDVATGQWYGFKDLEGVDAFLRQRMSRQPGQETAS